MRKTFALKVLHAEMCSVPSVLARFEREAVAAGNIEHPNVAQATDFGRLGDGSFFLVLEYVAGRSLRDELKKGPIDAPRAIKIMRGVVSGVAAAHAKGIVHRDLKPENVILAPRDGDPDFPKVLDFGIAKLEPDAPASSAGEPVLTRMGTLIGTPDYMSPEQALGQTVDARTDIYSLGVMFFEMLDGKPPFRGEPVEVIQQHLLKARPPLPKHVDPAIGLLLDKAMAKAAPERIQTAEELLAAIEKLPQTSQKKRVDRRWLLLGLVPIAGAAAFFAIRPKHEEDVDPAPSPPGVEPAASNEPLVMPDIDAWDPPTPSPSGTAAATPVSTTKAKTTTKAPPPKPAPKQKRKWWSYF
jgi:serine/threonine-protein kinase